MLLITCQDIFIDIIFDASNSDVGVLLRDTSALGSAGAGDRTGNLPVCQQGIRSCARVKGQRTSRFVPAFALNRQSSYDPLKGKRKCSLLYTLLLYLY